MGVHLVDLGAHIVGKRAGSIGGERANELADREFLETLARRRSRRSDVFPQGHVLGMGAA